MDSYDLPTVAAMVVLYGIGIAGSVLILRPSRRKREKASKSGQPRPAVDRWWTPSKVAIALGAGVPIGVNLIVPVVAGLGVAGSWIWTAAILMGGIALISGVLLACRLFASRCLSGEVTPLEKPAFDPEVFDLVGRRG